MEEITQEEVDRIIEESKMLDEGGKITNTIIQEKDKTTIIKKIELVEGENTSSKIVQTKDEININS